MWRIVNTDNFGGDYPDESFVGGFYESKADALKEADRLNRPGSCFASRYFIVVPGNYTLAPRFEP